MLREKLTEGETNPLWLSEPLSHLLSHGEGLAATALWFSFKKRSVRARVCTHTCVLICVGGVEEFGVFMCPSVHLGDE